MFRRMLIVLLVGLSSVSLAEAPKAPPTHKPSQKWALLIGINDYAYLSKLRYCGADMQALRNQLIESGFIDRQVRLLTDTASDKKYVPSKVNIETQVELLAKLAEEGDVLLVAFSGHGIERRGQGYLCPQDARVDSSDHSLIAVDWIYKRLGKSKAALRLILVDACREEIEPDTTRSASDAVEENRRFVKQLESVPKGTVLINSCGPDEFAREDRALSHGVFSHFLLNGLAGEADENGDGVVTVGELAKYTSRETKQYVALKYAYSQIPYIKQDADIGALDYDLARVRLGLFTGSWAGRWQNDFGESGQDTLVLKGGKDDSLIGTWSGDIPIEAKRLGPHSFSFTGKSTDVTYRGLGRIVQNQLRFDYFGQRKGEQPYRGQVLLQRSGDVGPLRRESTIAFAGKWVGAFKNGPGGGGDDYLELVEDQTGIHGNWSGIEVKGQRLSNSSLYLDANTADVTYLLGGYIEHGKLQLDYLATGNARRYTGQTILNR